MASSKSSAEEDALLPAFGNDPRSLFYVASAFSGHYSPIAQPRKHDFDVIRIAFGRDGPIDGAVAEQLTQQHFFDMRSLSVQPDGTHFLVSTSGYPIGSLIEEFEAAHPFTIRKIFQPHVANEPELGAAFGEAYYLNDGLDIVFTAATEPSNGGNFDYNVYTMSNVTGNDMTQRTRHTGMIDSIRLSGPGTLIVTDAGGQHAVPLQRSHM